MDQPERAAADPALDGPPDWWDLGPPEAGESGPSYARGPDLAPLIALLDSLRRVLPAELQAQFSVFVRELLLTVRALIDWYLERQEAGPREPRVEDIPID